MDDKKQNIRETDVMDKVKLNDELLDKVSGGFCDDFFEGESEEYFDDERRKFPD